MKVIDLLNKIANGKDVPEKISYFGTIYELKERNANFYNYKDNEGNYFEDDWFLSNILNDELEIIEDNKIEKLNEHYYHDEPALIDDMAHKINEIIDKVNNL